MTKRQMEIIGDNLRAFVANFGEPTIVKADYGNGFYVYRPGETELQSNWVQFCPNIHYLDGWLYGCVQGINHCIKRKGEKTL